MIQWILILTIPSLIVFLHMRIIKWLPYRWLVNSIIYPYHAYLMRKSFRLMSGTKKIDMWYEFQNRWFADYWFGRKLIKILEDDIDRVFR